MKVWIDQDRCTGAGMCELTVPDVFTLLEDGRAYVRQNGDALRAGGPCALAIVPGDLEVDVADAADACPGGCIHVEE